MPNGATIVKAAVKHLVLPKLALRSATAAGSALPPAGRDLRLDLFRGVALWLTVAYHETKDSPFAEQQELHRQVMRAIRALKDSIPAAELSQWFAAANEAQAA